MLCKVTHCAGCILANTRPHQLHWGDWEVGGTATISCIECSQVAGLIQKSVETPQKASSLRTAYQLQFEQTFHFSMKKGAAYKAISKYWNRTGWVSKVWPFLLCRIEVMWLTIEGKYHLQLLHKQAHDKRFAGSLLHVHAYIYRTNRPVACKD